MKLLDQIIMLLSDLRINLGHHTVVGLALLHDILVLHQCGH